MEYIEHTTYFSVQNANLNSETPDKVALKMFKVVTLLALIWSRCTYNITKKKNHIYGARNCVRELAVQYSRDPICIFIEN